MCSRASARVQPKAMPWHHSSGNGVVTLSSGGHTQKAALGPRMQDAHADRGRRVVLGGILSYGAGGRPAHGRDGQKWVAV